MFSLLKSCFGGAKPGMAALFCCLLAVYPVQAKTGPLSALVVAQQGIDQSDSTLFQQAVDLDSVLNKSAPPLLQALKEQAAAGKIPHSGFAMALNLASSMDSAGQAALLIPLLGSEVKSFVAAGINGGYFAGKPNGTVKASPGSLASTLGKMPEGRREIVPGKVLSQDGGKASVSGTFVDPGAGRIPLVLTVEEKNGLWRITEIANSGVLVNRAFGATE